MHLPGAHRRGSYNIARAPESSRSTSLASATHSGNQFTTATAMPHDGSKKLSSTSKAVIASVTSCFGVAILIILGVYLYRRRRQSPSVVFDTDLTNLNGFGYSPHHYREWSSTTDQTLLGYQPQSMSPLRNDNVDDDEKMASPTLAFPEAVAGKGRLPRSKPTWLSPITTEGEMRPPAYGISSDGQEILIPIPPQRPPRESNATPLPSTPSVSWKSHASTSKISLVIPDHDPVPFISPARSESFVPKDLVPPSPPNPLTPSTFGLNSTKSKIGSSRVEHDTEVKLARLMTVVALFTPNLSDELHVKVGDTVRIIEEYEDGWCFVQFLGKKDAPKGVVPLVCLQERKRLVPFTHKAPNRSSNWRYSD